MCFWHSDSPVSLSTTCLMLFALSWHASRYDSSATASTRSVVLSGARRSSVASLPGPSLPRADLAERALEPLLEREQGPAAFLADLPIHENALARCQAPVGRYRMVG